MNNTILIILCCLIILLFVIKTNKNKELFIGDEEKSKLLNGIRMNMGEMENINMDQIKKIPNSEKIIISNMVKKYSIHNLLFNKNVNLKNYTNMGDLLPNNLELNYEQEKYENINNFLTGFVVGNDFSTDKNNKYYGIEMKYFNSKKFDLGRAEISIDFKSYMDLNIGKLLEMKKLLLEEKEKLERQKVEIMTKKTKKFEFLPYFKDDNIKSLVLFKKGQNKEFLESCNGYFNLVDGQNNRILTKCKLDSPFCKVHLPQKRNIYGRDNYIAGKFVPYNDKFKVIVKDDIDLNTIERFVGDFQDDSANQTPPLHNYYQKYLTKKECINDKDSLQNKISIKHYLEEEELDLISTKEKLDPLEKLAGTRCIKHFNKFRDEFFFGGFDKENNMMCYGKNDECILFNNKKECQKLNLEKLLSVPKGELVKGIKYTTDRNYYSEDLLKEHQIKLGANFEEDNNGNIIVKCDNGKYLEGTYNPDDELSILGGIYKKCNDPKHPKNDQCVEGPGESPEYHLAELITNNGNKIYDETKNDKYSNFGELDGNCIKNNIPEGKMEDCDALDNHQACYVGKRDSIVPGESIENTDIYKTYLSYNCHTYTLKSNTCKHNNNGVLSDIVTFSEPLEKNYLELIENQKILQKSIDYIGELTDEEKYDSENFHFYIEKYEELYENMNPINHFHYRYKIKFEEHYDDLSKKDSTNIVLKIYYKKNKTNLYEEETTLTTNNDEKLYYLTHNDIIEILLSKDNKLTFKISNKINNNKVNYISKHPIDGIYGSPINFYVAQNNNTFLQDIKYKEEIPTTILPYNPFIDIEQTSSGLESK